MKKELVVDFTDERHVWIEGKQFIRLDRFLELKNDRLNEMEILVDEVDRLNKDNNTLREYIEYLRNC